MSAFKVPNLVLAGAVVLAGAAPLERAQAQEAYDPEDTVYATGAVLETEDELAGVPRAPLFRAYLPPSVDLSARFPPAGEQGEQGSCVGWAVGYAARSYYNSSPAGGARLAAHEIPSPAYIYNAIQRPDPSCGGGSRITDALRLLEKGALTLAEYPYDERRCPRPDAGSRARATKFRIADWRVVDTERLDQVKGELAGGHPVVIGMLPNREFQRLRGNEVWRAGRSDEAEGGHAVTAVGYSERGRHFTVINSWGQRWGQRGFGRISYDTFRKRVKYGFSMRLTEPEPPPPPEPPKPEPPEPTVPELVLPEIGCGRIAIEERDGKQAVVGFVGTGEDLSRIREAADRSKARLEVDLRPWPQCEALMTIEKPLAHPSAPTVSLPKSSYRVSETLHFDVRMAGFQGYLHVAYVQADGNVVNLVRSDPLTLATLPAGTGLTFGDGLEGRSKFTVSAPFGNEMIVALASKSPLFAENRPPVETEREFLTALRKAIVARPDPTQPERVVSASFVTLETKSGEKAP